MARKEKNLKSALNYVILHRIFVAKAQEDTCLKNYHLSFIQINIFNSISWALGSLRFTLLGDYTSPSPFSNSVHQSNVIDDQNGCPGFSTFPGRYHHYYYTIMPTMRVTCNKMFGIVMT